MACVDSTSILPADLSDIVIDYADISDLVAVSLQSGDGLPSRAEWKRILKRRFPRAYLDFITHQFQSCYRSDEATAMVMAGLYRPAFGLPLTLAPIIDADEAMQLYLMLTHRDNPHLDPQVMYNQTKTRMFLYTMGNAILYLIQLGANPEPTDFNNLLTFPLIIAKIITIMIRRRIPILNVNIGRYTVYQELTHRYPNLALKYINKVKISWDDFKSVGRLVFEAPREHYRSLFQAYFDRIGPVPLMYQGELRFESILLSVKAMYSNMPLDIQRVIVNYTNAMIAFLDPHNREMYQHDLRSAFVNSTGETRRKVYREILHEFPTLAVELINEHPIKWGDFVGYYREDVVDIPAYEKLAQMYYERVGPSSTAGKLISLMKDVPPPIGRILRQYTK